jgi:hypothetical protein
MRYIYFRILAGLVLIIAIAGIAFIAYNAGVTNGAAANNQASAAQNNGQPVPFYGTPYWRPFGFFGFGCLAPLALLFLLFLAFGALRSIFWGPRHGWRRMHHGYYPWGYHPWGDKSPGEEIPPMFAEMHRRMHAAEVGKTADTTPQK